MSTRRCFAAVRSVCAALACLAIAGCGYHLRGSTPSSAIPASVQRASVSAPTGLRNALYVALQARGLATSEDSEGADIVVRGNAPRFERRLLSVDERTAEAREYELLLEVRYSVDRPGATRLIEDGRALVQRDLLVDSDAIIGKRNEESVLRQEMQREAAERIVDRIAARLAAS